MNFAELATKIKALRKANGYTQSELAEYSGVSRATINALENGRASDIGVKKLINLFSVLGHELTVIEQHRFPTFDELVLSRNAES
jgi:transcriptional regulator with XRE-family HTH domain